ncbi:MAG: hypothetical protein ACI9JM_000533 [Halioglobus sp.]|jgi:hypothetical protein
MLDRIKKTYLPTTMPSKEGLALASTGIFIAVVALLLEFYGWQGPFLLMAEPVFGLQDLNENTAVFYAQIYTSASFFFLLVLLPLLFHLAVPLRGTNPYGLRFSGFSQNVKPYYPLLLIMLPVVWIVCGSESFNQFYPLYKPTTLSDFVLYEAIYLTQFFAVEFFYRGFCLFRFEKLAPGFGIFIMVIPYALLHIHKPFPEALGSIVAGLVLGALALKGRSIWPGIMCHCIVAFSADFFALWRSGRFAELF